jgi:hypothetical protein
MEESADHHSSIVGLVVAGALPAAACEALWLEGPVKDSSQPEN